MPDILLATLNARWHHCAFGLRYLFANLGEVAARAGLMEFVVREPVARIAARILAARPRIVGLGVYIWNVRQTTELVALLKRADPAPTVVVGGPEVSHEVEEQTICTLADHVVTGEADLAFRDLCGRLLAGAPDVPHVVHAPPPDLGALALPYHLYDADDVARRMVYVEASRGCPFTCAFCLSALDVPVRRVDLARLLPELERLLARGVRHFKFVDRTFNLDLATSTAILDFFLARITPGLILHFEMIPDRLPEALRRRIAAFPPGTLHLEVGVQSLDPAVNRRIARRQDEERLAENLRWLHGQDSVHVHADLIAGLPGETWDGFARGFDRLCALRPHEIQVGILKRLRGTPLTRHDAACGMVWDPEPPYEVRATAALDSVALARLRRFARVHDLVANRGNFVHTTERLRGEPSPFAAFLALAEYVHRAAGRSHGLALHELYRLVHGWLVEERGADPVAAARLLALDYRRTGRCDPPRWLSALAPAERCERGRLLAAAHARRQARHRGVAATPP